MMAHRSQIRAPAGGISRLGSAMHCGVREYRLLVLGSGVFMGGGLEYSCHTEGNPSAWKMLILVIDIRPPSLISHMLPPPKS